jgi:hypothetical protein
MAKRTTLYVACAVLILVTVIAVFTSHKFEKFTGKSQTGVKWCTTPNPTPATCTTRANSTLQPTLVARGVKSLQVFPGYQAQTSTSSNCGNKSTPYTSRNVPYTIKDQNVKCIYSGQASTSTSA